MAEHTDAWFWRMRRGEAPEPPVAGLLGQRFEAVDAAAGTLRMRFEAAPTFLNPAGQVQGGMLGAMLDAATASIVDATLAPQEVVATLNLQLSFLRPAMAGELMAEARIVRRGRQVAFVEATLQQDGRAVAKAQATCMIVGRPA